ncbi:hypothetical protein [Ligilactobacillus equi]|uniref:Uncharacterized protein n=1 Tax=Ligilactobacillus equi DSM 15833 = JCM 10991 TaxID=1423740 RepID=A0A0R1TZ96_9LACO|nr:hypothetical protein [Ligilactobacillus equi]KRL84426.1 hypothetical protein FC36_GL000184 [Ligilactobacillus equi DSM 15833 = JCM 10991]
MEVKIQITSKDGKIKMISGANEEADEKIVDNEVLSALVLSATNLVKTMNQEEFENLPDYISAMSTIDSVISALYYQSDSLQKEIPSVDRFQHEYAKFLLMATADDLNMSRKDFAEMLVSLGKNYHQQ